jgi:alpha-glucosidase (family GH31 glycosyl hydrolase)
MPIMRALWLHYPDDPVAVARGDQYLWGRDMLVAPVVEKGATSRTLYLPRGAWFDFWTEEKHDGGREINRAVDLATMPLYVRAGAVIPMGPVKQYTAEAVDGPLSFTVYPGADGAFEMFEDDGRSFEFRQGGWMGITCRWSDRSRRLSLSLTGGSKMRPPLVRDVEVRLAGTQAAQRTKFAGRPITIQL